MLTRIETKHLPIKAQNEPMTLHRSAQPDAVTATRTMSRISSPSTGPDPLGVQLMREKQGENFTNHYYSAWNAAGRIDGKEFLDHYRSLKNCAREQGMSAEEFRGFERCLYQRFYRAASRDSMQRIQDGRELRVQPSELAYIAKVADISESQLSRDAIALRRSETTGQMNAIASRHGMFFRSKGLA
jgi:hypothetical protein